MKRFCLTKSLFLLSIALLYSAPVTAQVLSVDLDTDQLPGTEFTGIRTTLWEGYPGGVLIGTQSVPAYVGEVFPKRVAEFGPLAGGDYEVLVELLDFAGTHVNHRTVLVDSVQENRHITAIISRLDGPSPITKEAALFRDNDESGDISAGDEVRYTVRSSEESFDVFTDMPGVGSRLVAGDVVSSHGVVTEGNALGDTSVRVEGMGGFPGEEKIIHFQVELIPAVSNQGVGLLDDGEWLSRVLTDDPSLPGDHDPTVTPISCSYNACEEELEMCEDDLADALDEIAGLEEELKMCEDDLADAGDEIERLENENSELRAALADADEDGVRDFDDQCPASDPGSDVDAAGCTQSQACGAIDASGSGHAMCRQYDWMSDEPLGMPNDCRVESRMCVAVP